MPLAPIKEYGSSRAAFLGALCFGVSVAAFVVLIIRAAWLCDDAFITFRTVDNFVNGYGLTWNTFERVQAYTHPLWMFLLSLLYWIFGNIYITSIFTGLFVSTLAVCLLGLGLARSWPAALCAVFMLGLSRAFVDYATSGLENPLTHLLLAVYFCVFFAPWPAIRKVLPMALLLALGTLNRMDTLLLFAPAMAWVMLEARSFRAVFLAALGLTPFVAWEFFSIIYYGFPFPNTAYAKLNNGIEPMLFYQQGIAYYISQSARDPLTLVMILFAIPLPFFIRDKRAFFVSIGMALYLVYVVRIGGDFMMGRFLTAPLFMAAVLLCMLPWRWQHSVLLLVPMLGMSLLPNHPVLLNTSEYGVERHKAPGNVFRDMRGVSDQRGFYYHSTGLLRASQNNWEVQHGWAQQGRRARQQGRVVRIAGAVGFIGYYGGPDFVIADYHALTDPLMARMPVRNKTGFHIGHFKRTVPEGYILTLSSGVNQIKNPELKKLYDELVLITQGALWSKERWKIILKLNTGLGGTEAEQKATATPAVRQQERRTLIPNPNSASVEVTLEEGE